MFILGNLKRHSLGHTGSKPYACDICSSRFTEKKSLKVHMRIHTGERPFHCELCDQKFAQRSTLKSHMSVHNKKKPHLCDLCGRSFSQKSNLKAHKTRHFSQRNFHCDYCDCKFHNKGDLMRHMKGHVGLKDLSCTVCFKVFTRKNTLTEHMNKHYDIKPWECIRCSIKFHTRNQGKQHLKEKEGDGFHNNEGLEEDLIRKLQISFSEKQVNTKPDIIGGTLLRTVIFLNFELWLYLWAASIEHLLFVQYKKKIRKGCGFYNCFCTISKFYKNKKLLNKNFLKFWSFKSLTWGHVISHKFWSWSVQPFWRLLDKKLTYRQTASQI